jgi:hypothetical protein
MEEEENGLFRPTFNSHVFVKEPEVRSVFFIINYRMIYFQMSNLFVFLFIFILIKIMYPWLSSSDRVELTSPVNTEDVKRLHELISDKHVRSSIEEFPVLMETIKDFQFNYYIDLLLNQHENSGKLMRDYIARIPPTEQGQHFSIALCRMA